MSVDTTDTYSGPYSTNGSTTAFPFTFKAMAEGEVSVEIDGDAVSDALYTVTLDDDGGGTVTFDTAPVTGGVLYVKSDPDFTQQVTFENGSRWLASPVNQVNDRAAVRDLVLKGMLDRSLVAPVGEDAVDYWTDYFVGTGLFKGDPGGNVMSIGTRDVAFSATISAGTNRIATDGAVARSDGGAADYVYDSEQPAPGVDALHRLTSAGKTRVQAAVVRTAIQATAQAAAEAMENRFRVVNDTGRFRLRGRPDHLALAASGDSDLDTIQASLDAYNHWGQELGHIAPGSYTLGGSLYVTRGEAPGYYYQVQLKGAGKKFYNGVGHGTALVFTDKTRPGLILQGYRHSSVHDMTLIGAAYTALSTYYLGGVAPVDGLGDLIDDTDIATWYTYAGLEPRRYAPHAAIALDPRAGTAPGGSVGTLTAPYPTDANPDWLGPTAQYGKPVGSTFETNCEMLGWEVGMTDPAAINDQGDYTTGQKISVALSIYGLGPSRSQGRNFTIYEANIALVHTVLTNRVFGMKQGKLGGTITLSGGASIKLFDLDATIMGGLILQNCYTEAQYMIGDVVCGTYSGATLSFINGQLELGGGNVRRASPMYHLGDPTAIGGGIPNYCPVTVRDTFFGVEDALAMLANDLKFDGQIIVRSLLSGLIDPSNTDLNSSGFDKSISSSTERRARRMAHNGTLGLITPRMAITADHRISGQLFDIDGNADTRQVTTNQPGYDLTSRSFCIPHWQRSVWFPDASHDVIPSLEVVVPHKRGPIAKTSISSFTRTGLRWAGTLSASYRGANAYVAVINNVGPGRICYDDQSGTAFWVCSYDFTTGAIVLEQLYNYYVAAGQTVPQPRNTISTTVGTLWFAETGFFTTNSPLIGDITSGSPTISNIRRSSDGDNAWIAGAGASLPQAADWLHFDSDMPTAAQSFTGAASKVSSINTGAFTITMAGSANITQTGISLPLWRRGS